MRTFGKAVSAAIALFGFIVALEWVLGIPMQSMLFPFSITMKFTTAVAFVLSGIILDLLFECREAGTELSEILLPICILVLFIWIFPVMVSGFFGIKTGFEQLFIQEAPGAAQTTFPGKPTIVADLDFLILVIIGASRVFKPDGKLAIEAAGAWIMLSGAIPIMGYIANVPGMYYDFPDVTNPMAITTAVLFVLLGAGMYMAGIYIPAQEADHEA